MLKNVVLPAPFGPISETIEPRGIEKSMSFVATRPPNSFRTWSATRRASCSTVLSVILGLAVGVGRFVRHVVRRRVGDPELELDLVPPLRDQPFRPQQHHQHDDHP